MNKEEETGAAQRNAGSTKNRKRLVVALVGVGLVAVVGIVVAVVLSKPDQTTPKGAVDVLLAALERDNMEAAKLVIDPTMLRMRARANACVDAQMKQARCLGAETQCLIAGDSRCPAMKGCGKSPATLVTRCMCGTKGTAAADNTSSEGQQASSIVRKLSSVLGEGCEVVSGVATGIEFDMAAACNDVSNDEELSHVKLKCGPDDVGFKLRKTDGLWRVVAVDKKTQTALPFAR